jgi:hypothetical protein
MTPTTPSPISDQAAGEPIPMLLFCPKCHAQHIDSPKWERDLHDMEQGLICTWTNPPHKSHLCHVCGNIWRPADVETTGVVCIQTKGKADTWDSTAPTTVALEADAVTHNGKDIMQIWFECNRDVFTFYDRITAPTTGSAPETDDTFIEAYKVAKLCDTIREANKAIVQGHGSSWYPLYRKNHPKPASPVASVLSEDAILAIAIDHGLGTAVVESIVKALLAASMGGEKA